MTTENKKTTDSSASDVQKTSKSSKDYGKDMQKKKLTREGKRHSKH
jgi:hypothetical protein